MPLYKATITQKRRLHGGVFIEPGMTLNFPCVGNPWSHNKANEINNAFIRVYGIDLKAGNVLSPGFVLVEEVK